MHFLIENDDFSRKYKTILDKVKTDIKKKRKKNNSEPVYNKFFLKTKVKPHGDKVTDFYKKKNS